MTVVMIVEDEIEFRGSLEVLFSLNGFAVTTADNGEAALDVVASERPDIIVSDVMMPIRDGISLCANLRARAETRSIPIILLTAVDSLVDRRGELYDDLLVKPIDFPVLLDRVNHHLGRSASARA